MAIIEHPLGTLNHRFIDWYTPSHGLYAIGKGQDGTIYAGRRKRPHFIISGDTQAEIEKEAGRLINAKLE